MRACLNKPEGREIIEVPNDTKEIRLPKAITTGSFEGVSLDDPIMHAPLVRTFRRTGTGGELQADGSLIDLAWFEEFES